MFATPRRSPSQLNRYQKGASILTAIFLITALAVLGSLMTKLTITSNQETINEMYSAQALYAAESGTDWAAYHILNNDTCSAADYPPYTATVPVSATSTVEVSINCAQTGKSNQTINLYHITVTGKAGGTRAQRQLTVQFIPTL